MKIISLSLSLMLLIAIGGCKKNAPYPADYVGTWTNNQAEITLNADSTYILKNIGASETNGIYRTSPNTLIFFDKSGACGDSVAGSYDWRYLVESITGTFYPTLTLTLLEDTCGVRVALVPGKYRKQ